MARRVLFSDFCCCFACGGVPGAEDGKEGGVSDRLVSVGLAETSLRLLPPLMGLDGVVGGGGVVGDETAGVGTVGN